jgi:hypothetical protein
MAITGAVAINIHPGRESIIVLTADPGTTPFSTTATGTLSVTLAGGITKVPNPSIAVTYVDDAGACDPTM